MKILIVGAWRWPQYEEAFAQGLTNAGIQTCRFSTESFFSGSIDRRLRSFPFETPTVSRMNRAIVECAEADQPDWVLFWRPTHVTAETVQTLGRRGIQTVSYNNDDPFSPAPRGLERWRHRLLWRQYLNCLPKFDMNFFFRAVNCAEALARGARHADVLLPYFQPWQDRPIDLEPEELQRFQADVVFAGHFENDGRGQAVKALRESGLRTKVWSGAPWPREIMGNEPIGPALGIEYAKALAGAKVCLAFLSKLNRDTYTRRCFEIPACAKVMLAERTKELQQFFKEDEEACYFSSTEELVAKAHWLAANPGRREAIARAGLQRVWRDGHDVTSRAQELIEKLRRFTEGQKKRNVHAN